MRRDRERVQQPYVKGALRCWKKLSLSSTTGATPPPPCIAPVLIVTKSWAPRMVLLEWDDDDEEVDAAAGLWDSTCWWWELVVWRKARGRFAPRRRVDMEGRPLREPLLHWLSYARPPADAPGMVLSEAIRDPEKSDMVRGGWEHREGR